MISRVLILILLAYSHQLETVGSANILAIYPSDNYSHSKVFQPLLEELIRRGHNLTLLSRILLSDEFRGDYTRINIEKCNFKINKLSDIEVLDKNTIQAIVHFTKGDTRKWETMIKCPEVQELINSKTEFHLIISELFLGSDVFFALGKKFGAPIISTTSQCLLSYHKWILGNPDPFFFPDSFMKVTDTSLGTRALNLGFQLLSTLFYEFYCLPWYQNLVEKYFNFEKENIPSIKEIMKNISVSLVNSHYSLGFSKPDLPNVVNVAGIHLTIPKPLPVHVQKFMDEAEHGVIYVSFGSLLDASIVYHLGVTLINILKILPQRIIVKWDQTLAPYGSEKILTGEWFPQSDILNHPNCRLFITHGGYLSLLESLNASVPVIGVPFFGDQHYNLGMVEKFGLGMKVDRKNIPLELPGKIDEVLKNPKYKNNMKKRSLLFQNRLTSPLDTAMYWVDHVLQHKDTSHLKPASVRLAWYEFYSLDVLGILLVLLGTVLYALKFMMRKLIFLILSLSAKAQTWWTIKSSRRLTKTDFKRD